MARKPKVDEGAAAEIEAAAEPRYVTEQDGVKRKLVKPITVHGGAVLSEIKLRRPRYRDVMDNGDPTALILVEGGMVPQIDMMIIERYIVALSGLDALVLEQLDYLDALALRDAVRSFFTGTR